MAIRAVVFDLFDTLVDLSMDGLPMVEVNGRRFPSTLNALHALLPQDSELALEQFSEALFAVDRELRKERADQGRELPTLERFQVLLERLDLQQSGLAERLTDTHMSMLRGQVTSVPHHPELLRGLRERLLVGVCSNFSHSQTALRVLEDAGLRWHCDAVVVSDAVGFRKPRPEIFHATLAALGVSAEETLHVGDSLPADVGGAAALGIRTAWVTRRVGEPSAALAKHEGPRPDFVVSDLAEIPGLLET